ncbi:LysR substrate-binding domain-containing protein [Bowmanella yangjiangensis]|uniref:LysR family transcriptional regulator n=1 Tax=Bowmanella yangjiangensis TaxID=2811230 RepID=A0ABS3CRB0_9ALTE|nr:LysR substrate-binding domain-containing protein [Bowmanella yangjiangensis]MBN7819652.1 LysR family transcriptional regulator [Bowmanella yangjiangensis]
MDKRLRHLPALRCFDAAARNQSYRQAADELAITQAAVSQQIRALEEGLGVKLFYRDGRRMRLTARGQTLANSVEQAFAQLVRGFNTVQCEEAAGVLTVTTTGSFASMWLMPRLWKFSVEHPQVSIRVMASPYIEDLRHGDIDIAIRQGNGVWNELCQEVIISDPVFAVCSKRMADEMQLTDPAQVNQCLLVEGHDPGLFSWQNWFSQAGLEFNRKALRWVEVATWEMSINAVAAGHGICLSTSTLAGELIKRGTLVRPFEIEITPGPTFSILHNPDSPRLARIKVFRDWLKKELAENNSPATENGR